jgi:hypothetical protein
MRLERARPREGRKQGGRGGGRAGGKACCGRRAGGKARSARQEQAGALGRWRGTNVAVGVGERLQAVLGLVRRGRLPVRIHCQRLPLRHCGGAAGEEGLRVRGPSCLAARPSDSTSGLGVQSVGLGGRACPLRHCGLPPGIFSGSGLRRRQQALIASRFRISASTSASIAATGTRDVAAGESRRHLHGHRPRHGHLGPLGEPAAVLPRAHRESLVRKTCVLGWAAEALRVLGEWPQGAPALRGKPCRLWTCPAPAARPGGTPYQHLSTSARALGVDP